MAARHSKTTKRPAAGDAPPGSSVGPSKRSKKSSSSKEERDAAARAKEELRLHQAIEKSIQKAIKEASIREVVSPTGQGVSQPGLAPPVTPTPPENVQGQDQNLPPLSPDGGSYVSPLQGEVREVLFGVQPVPSAPTVPAEAPPPQPSTSQAQGGGDIPLGSNISPELVSFLQAAIKKGVQAELQHRTSSWVSSACSQHEGEGSLLDVDHAATGVAGSSASPSVHLSLSGEEVREGDLSEDEDLAPDQPSFVGLFKPQLFRSLLHKAKLTTRLGSTSSQPSSSQTDTTPAVPLFEEPVIETEEIPGPSLFREVLRKQWAAPASGPNPNQLDRRLYNLAPELASLLQIPVVDPPVAALTSPANLAGAPEDNLRPEEKRLEQSLVKSHMASAWAARSALASSFFNRAAILWLRQLQDRLPVSDTRSQQDLSKILAALEFSADATLNSSRFAAKSIGSSVTARRLLWLRNWQADAKSKWRLATSAFEGPSLFGAPLEPLLIETKDKRRILPSVSRRSEHRSSNAPFRSFRTFNSYSGPRSPRAFSTRSRPPDRQGFHNQRGQPKRPFRGGRGRPFNRSR